MRYQSIWVVVVVVVVCCRDLRVRDYLPAYKVDGRAREIDVTMRRLLKDIQKDKKVACHSFFCRQQQLCCKVYT